MRIGGLAPSLFIALLVGVAGCASTAPARGPVDISSGDARVPIEPSPQDIEPDPAEETEEPGAVPDQASLDELLNLLGQDGKGYTPPFMRDRDITRVAVLLPFSHPNAGVRQEAEGLLAGAELALFERSKGSILLLPKDTRGSRSGAETAVGEALEEGADIIIGPLFSDNVKIAAEAAREEQVPVIAFSNDRSAAGNGAYLLSISPEVEVARVVDWAISEGVDSFAFLGPSSSYGRRAESALRIEAQRRGAFVIASEFYAPTNEAPVDEAKRLASVLKPEIEARPGRLAVLIPERGQKLIAVAPLLPYYDVDIRRLKLLGTGQWNDPRVWREPTLQLGVFPAANPQDAAAFDAKFNNTYGVSPSDLASLGYDATAMAIGLARQDSLDRRTIESRSGYRGVGGIFRFRIDGTAERGLAVLQITPEGIVTVLPAPVEFDRPES